MKRIFCALFALLLMLSTVIVSYGAEADLIDEGKTVVTYGDWILEKINSDQWWSLDSYIGSDQVVDAPYYIDQNMVVAIGDHCFQNNKTVKKVTTSSPLWTVGEYAFIDCTALEQFICNYALNTIKTGAFSGTSSLKKINLETSVVTEIAPYSFMNSGLEKVSLPETCTKIDEYAFAQCACLTQIDIPSSVTQIAETAFSGVDNLVICANHDAYAITYALEHGIDYAFADAITATFICGDADGDGDVTILDATRIQRVLAGLTNDEDGSATLRGHVTYEEEEAYTAPVLDIMDATRIQRWLADYSVPVPINTTVTRTYLPAFDPAAVPVEAPTEAPTEAQEPTPTELTQPQE